MSADIQAVVDATVKAAITTYSAKDLVSEQLGISFARLDPIKKTALIGSHRATEPMYPASVVKLFYLGYAAAHLTEGKLALTPEFERAIQDMIVDSNNDATGQVLDVITATTGGPELSREELKEWMEKRQAVNRWYAMQGLSGFNACQKTWNEGPYGRERQGYGPNFERRNSLTPAVCQQLLTGLALNTFHKPESCAFMRRYLERMIPSDGGKNAQAVHYIGKVLPKGSKLYSKAGWVTSERHDVAHVILPNQHEYVLAIFTKEHSSEESLIPFLADHLLAGAEEQG